MQNSSDLSSLILCVVDFHVRMAKISLEELWFKCGLWYYWLEVGLRAEYKPPCAIFQYCRNTLLGFLHSLKKKKHMFKFSWAISREFYWIEQSHISNFDIFMNRAESHFNIVILSWIEQNHNLSLICIKRWFHLISEEQFQPDNGLCVIFELLFETGT